MKPNRIFKCIESPFPAVDAVLNYGFAVIGGTTSFAVPFGKCVIEALAPYDDVNPHMDYLADYYVVVDHGRFLPSERNGRVAEAIRALNSSV